MFVSSPQYATAEGGGTVFMTCEEEDGTRTLVELNIAADGAASPPILHDFRGIPFDIVGGNALPGALCQAGQTLMLCDARQRRIPQGSSTHLDGMTRGHVYGRLAACSGMVVEGGHPHWFLVLMDLWRRQIAQQISWPRPACHPVLLGKYVFTIEDVPPNRTAVAGLCLVRRELSGLEPAGVSPASS